MKWHCAEDKVSVKHFWFSDKETVDLFTFTKDILSEKLHFLCSVMGRFLGEDVEDD